MIVFLNKDVEKEVVASPELYIAWRAIYGRYDSDIEPLHNPDWVRREQKNEAIHLADLKLQVLKFKAELMEFNVRGRF